MSKIVIPAGYKPALDLYQTQTAIGTAKRLFEDHLSGALNLRRVSAPLFVDPATGLNDDLNGVERPVSFDIPETGGTAQVVHSLAKWKRMALHQYGFSPGEGLYTDMNAIRRDEELSNLHSVYVDQWDWEKILPSGRRDMDYLKQTATAIVRAVCDTYDTLKNVSPARGGIVPRGVCNHDTGAGGPISGSVAKGAGKRTAQGTSHGIPHADRRHAAFWRQARRTRPRL